MKRMIVNKYGGPENLILEHIDTLLITELSVRIKVENIGVNFADTLVIRGRYQERPRPPFSPGLELSGTIIEIGSKKFKVLKKSYPSIKNVGVPNNNKPIPKID